MTNMIRSIVAGVGAHLPERVLTNDELAETVDTSDSWIRERTGIRQRHIAADGELSSDLGSEAAKMAIRRSGLAPDDIDLIVVATSTPDNTFPATAAAIQQKLAVPPCAAFDVQAVCAGFVYALTTADNAVRCGQARNALVIGAETFSRILDWQDRSTCVLFGDGAGAVVLSAMEQPGTGLDRGILATSLGADGRQYNSLFVDGGPSSTGTVGHLKMNGREVFRHAVGQLSAAALTVLKNCDMNIDDVDWLVPHQANLRIIDGVGKKLAVRPERVIKTVDCHANTSAASIPLALNEVYEQGKLEPGQVILTNAMGGGFAWGAALLRW